MRAHKLLGAGLMSMMLAASVMAAEPAPEAKPEAKLDEALIFSRQLDPAEALAKGRELRQRVDHGDAQAAFEFARMLTIYGRFGPSADAATLDEWSKLANDRSAMDWIVLAAEAGNQDAIGSVCRMAQDYQAPAHLQERGKARCTELRQKYPPK